MSFLQRHMAKILLALIVASAVGLLFFTYNLQRTLRTDVSVPPPASGDDGKVKVLEIPTLRPKDHYDLIAKRNIFAFPDEGKTKASAQTEQKPVETPLNVRLKGTVVSPEGFAVAMIEDPAQRKEDLYIVGDKIQDAEILKILLNQVLLRRAGREETLSLFADQPKGTSKGPQVPAAGLVRPGVPAPPPAMAGTPAVLPAQQRGAQQEIQNLMAQLRLRPNFQEGKPSGFVVGQVVKGSLFETSGLKEGDIVVGINDEEVKTPNQLLKAYREVSQDRELWLDIIRGGREESIEVNIESILTKE